MGRGLQKGGNAMRNISVTIDWKFIVALGTSVVGIIFAIKMDETAAERVSTNVVNACREFAITEQCNC